MFVRAKLAILIAGIAALPRSGISQELSVPAFPGHYVAAVQEIPAVLSLELLEQIALERNPTLVQAGAQIRISQGKAFQAGLYPNPQVGYVAEQIGAAGTAGELHGMFIEQEIVTGHKLSLSREKFLQESRQAELQMTAQRYRVLYGVRAAYYRALATQVRLELRQQLHDVSHEVSVTVTELLNVGQANRSDLLQAQIALQRAKAKLQTAESRYRASWEELAAVIGLPDMPPIQLTGDLTVGGDETLDRDLILAELLSCSPELRIAQAEVLRDRVAVRRERVEPIPNLNLRAETGYNFESGDTVAGVEIGVRLPLFDRNQGTIVQAQAELARAEAEVHRVELHLRRRFAQTFTEYESATLLARSFETEVLPTAREAYQLYLESFRERRAAWPQVLESQREYYELYEEYVDNVLAARRAEAKLSSYLLDDGLSPPPQPQPEGHRDATPKPR